METLDVLKIKNLTAWTNENGDAKQVKEPPASQRQEHIISNGHMNAASPNQHDRYQPPFTDANRKKRKVFVFGPFFFFLILHVELNCLLHFH
ncbi:hypothetical protein HanLR1_Chr16g0645161 [Helianthus annuus]|nr:hypothetical protein HanLR1_Chr16g0645161 [Helianthus annuus]